jgi:hypothetical protein
MSNSKCVKVHVPLTHLLGFSNFAVSRMAHAMDSRYVA